jgi:hypothetical protein
LEGRGDTTLAAAAASQLARAESASVTEGVSSAAVDACVLAQWRLAHDDTTDVAVAIGTLRAATTTMRTETAGPAAGCAALVDAWLAAVTGRAGARAQLDRTAALAFTPVTTGQVSAYAPLLLARLYERSGQRRRALEVLRRQPYMAGWPAYLATAWAEEGRLAEAMADSTSARRAYTRYLALRGEPEPEVAPRVDSVRRRLERLAGDGQR